MILAKISAGCTVALIIHVHCSYEALQYIMYIRMSPGINWQTPDLQILPCPAIDWKIWKALYSRGCRLFGRHAGNSSDVTLPLKMTRLSNFLLVSEVCCFPKNRPE